MTKKNSKTPKKTKKVFPVKAVLFSALGIVLGLGLATGGLAYYVSGLPEEVFVSKTTVEGFSGSTAENRPGYEAFSSLDTAVKTWASERLLQPLSLESERGSVPVTLTALGVDIDWTLLDRELKDEMSTAGLLEKMSTYLFGQEVELPVLISEETLAQTLLKTDIEQGNKNAVFGWDGTAVFIEPGQIGYGIEKEELLSFLEDSFRTSILSDTVELTLRTSQPEITDAALTAILPDAEVLAQRDLSLQDEFGNTWDLALKDHLAWVIPNGTGEGLSTEFEAAWTLDQTGFINYVEITLVPEVEEDPTAVVITENEDGSISFEGSARFGKELDKLALLDLVLEKLQPQPAFPESEVVYADEPIALPIEKVLPAVTVPDSLAAKGVTDLVGFGYSDFGGSPVNRVHNIKTGIAQFNGVLVEQGAEFSFMGHMTPVDAEHGFLPELVIKGDETIPEYGGGLCQISSTMFRAALYSGLPITARRNHSYAVSYYARPYGFGLDATVYDPAPDLKFINDTAGSLLIQSYTDGESAFYVFYGTNDGRTVTMEGPYSYDYNTVDPETIYTDKLEPGVRELKEYSHTGFTTDWYRTVTYLIPSAETLATEPSTYVSPYAATVSGVRENIHSVYEARPAKYWEGQTGESTEVDDE